MVGSSARAGLPAESIVPSVGNRVYTPLLLDACPVALSRTTPAEVRFWARVLPIDDGCWQWLGALEDGYGHICVGGRRAHVHRFAYEAMVGRVPEGMVLDHLCRNRACVNPAHLEPVTKSENTRRSFGIGMRNKAKARCKAGHSLVPHPRKPVRYCPECERAAKHAYVERRRAEGWVRSDSVWKRVEDVNPNFRLPHEHYVRIGQLSEEVRRARRAQAA